jgi:hypothetical protein
MGIKEIVTAARSPWQNAYVERIIGSLRRECLDHVIIFDEHHLRGVLSSYFHYYHKTRTHLSLAKDCPESRPIHLPTAGKIIPFPEVGPPSSLRTTFGLTSRGGSTAATVPASRAVPFHNCALRIRCCP